MTDPDKLIYLPDGSIHVTGPESKLRGVPARDVRELAVWLCRQCFTGRVKWPLYFRWGGGWKNQGFDPFFQDSPIMGNHVCHIGPERHGDWHAVKLTVPQAFYDALAALDGVGAGAPVSDLFENDSVLRERLKDEREREATLGVAEGFSARRARPRGGDGGARDGAGDDRQGRPGSAGAVDSPGRRVGDLRRAANRAARRGVSRRKR